MTAVLDHTPGTRCPVCGGRGVTLLLPVLPSDGVHHPGEGPSQAVVVTDRRRPVRNACMHCEVGVPVLVGTS